MTTTNERLRKLAHAATISDRQDIEWLEAQLSRQRYFVSMDISNPDDFKTLFRQNPTNATEIYWKEIDSRNQYLRTSSHRMIKEHTDLFLTSFDSPLISAASLRALIECTVKFIGINWAITAMYNQIAKTNDNEHKGIAIISSQLETVLMSYSHFTKAKIEPLFHILHNNVTIEEALLQPMDTNTQKQHIPTIGKLFGVATFLEPQLGPVLKYIYSTVCDLLHSGPLALALKDAYDLKRSGKTDIKDMDSFKMHGMLPEILMSTYPIIGYKAVLICFKYLDKYLFSAPQYSFWEPVEKMLSTERNVIDITFDWVDQFLKSDESIILNTSEGIIRVYK